MWTHDDEVLTDNTKIKRCQQCKDCMMWGKGDNYSNAYDKSSCLMYPYPNFKPLAVINDQDICPYKVTKGGGGGG